MPDQIRRRPDEDTERELRVNRSSEPPPGGAAGGDESPSADVPPAVPADDQAPAGDTDQHTNSDNLPPQREQEHRG